MNKLKLILILFFFSAIAIKSFSHNQNYDKVILHEWTVNENTKIKASFLMFKNDEVYLQKDNSETVHFPLADFSSTDQQCIIQRYNRIQKLNSQYISTTVKNNSAVNSIDFSKILVTVFVLLLILSLTYFFGSKNKVRYISYFSAVAFLAVIYSFQIKSTMQTNSVTDPLSVDSAFTPFKPNIVTSWDSNYFYVESFGIPTTHNMMTGITSWQQQVPIPQCYIKPNAWMIPLNPVVAAVPVPVDSIHFTRGAIAVAINGIPIFNYHTNTGVDSYLDGQLDQWGGHCGRADDYHYHIAPMQLYSNTPINMPVAYALDGFAVYGTVEPDGSALLPLDANHGHYWTNGVYHYHGTATPVAPYMIGKMVGQVTEDPTHQIIPQPHAQPVRPGLTPLTGAVITNCIPNANNNGYTLIYTVGVNTDSVVYSWTSAGVYTFNFYHSGTLDSTRNYNGFIPCLLPTSVSEINYDGNKIQLFPNPSRNEFSLKLNNVIEPSEIKNITILSNKGETVFSSNTYQDKYKTDNLSNGIYFVIIKTSNNTLTKKLVLQ
ncbi:MAG: YHYH protein [Chitinophagia bacterium]|nr:YHYH protein [Chitinophagia bacterium]